MSTLYYANITLNVKFNAKSIEHVIANGINNRLGYSLFNKNRPIDNISSLSKEICLNFEKTSKNPFLNFPSPMIGIKIEKSEGNIFFWKSKNDLLQVDIGGFTLIKKQLINNYSHIDWAHYIRLSLNLCKDFGIVSIQIKEI